MYMAAAKHLVSLNISDCDKITDAGIRILATSQSIEDLTIPDLAGLTADSFDFLAAGKIPLRSLTIGCYPLEPVHIASIVRIRSLQLLSVTVVYEAVRAHLEALKAEQPDIDVRISVPGGAASNS